MLLRTCSCYQQLTQTPSEPSLAKYRGEQVPVRHAEKTFSKYRDAEDAKLNAKLKRGEGKKAIVIFPGN